MKLSHFVAPLALFGVVCGRGFNWPSSVEGLVPIDSASAAYSAFTHHFSSIEAHGGATLLDKLRKLHPTSAVIATQGGSFDFRLFASAVENDAFLEKSKGAKQLMLQIFAPPARRTDGFGGVAERPFWGVFDLRWAGQTFRLYEAQWETGYNQYRQVHIVGDSEDNARTLLLTVSTFANSLNEAILVFDQSRWTPDHDLWRSVQKASWDDVILDAGLKKAVKHEYTSFFNSSDMYKDLGVPWKRGVIFLGPPGNGKTISLKAIMKYAGVPALYVKTFHTWSGDEYGIRMIFERARQEAPCLLILEDLDSLINDGNRSFFLNELDGLEDNDGLLLIGTTNHFSRLDPALSNRPSRFDRKYNFPDPNQEERRMYAVYWQKKLRGNPKIDFPDSLLDEVAAATPKFSFAYLKEAFVAALITLAGDESESPPSFATLLLKQIALLKEQLEKGDPEDVVSSPTLGGPLVFEEVAQAALPWRGARPKQAVRRPL